LRWKSRKEVMAYFKSLFQKFERTGQALAASKRNAICLRFILSRRKRFGTPNPK